MSTETNSVKPKNRLRLNIIDFLIIIVIIGAAVGIALRSGVVQKVTNQSGLESARISFLVQDINDASADYFNIGDEFKSISHGCKLGKLESRQFLPAEAFVVNEYGQIFKTYSENHRIDVRGVLIGSGTFSDEGFLLEGTNFIAPGTSIRMQSTNMDVWITVTGIEKAEDAK